MSAKRCPLCGETVSGEECFSCGYIFPDLEKLSAPYDLDPSNDLFGAAADESGASSLLPDMGSVSIENIPVLETAAAERAKANEGVQISQDSGAAFKSMQAGAVPNIKVRPAAAPPAVTPQRNAVPKQYAQQPAQPPQYGQSIPPASNIGTGIVRSVVDFVTAHWWQLLLMFIMPSLGMIFGFFYIGMGKLNNKTGKTALGIALIILSFIMMIKGIDFFGMDQYLWMLLD